MAKHNQSPIRDQARTEILSALAGGEFMSIDQIFDRCPTLSDRGELARLAYDMTRNGTLEKGEQILNKQNKAVNTYRIGTGHTPSADHPWKQATVTPKQPVEPRVTRPLPVHLQTPIPPVWASQEGVECPPEEYLDQELINAISQLKDEDEIMTEETANYMTTEEEACMHEALDQDDVVDVEDARLAIVDAMLAYAHDELRGNRAWKSLERAYLAVSGDNLGSRHDKKI